MHDAGAQSLTVCCLFQKTSFKHLQKGIEKKTSSTESKLFLSCVPKKMFDHLINERSKKIVKEKKLIFISIISSQFRKTANKV